MNILLVWFSALNTMYAVRTPTVVCPAPANQAMVSVYIAEQSRCISAPASLVAKQLQEQYENDNTISHPERD